MPGPTERLRLRTWTEEDVDAFVDLYSREDVYRYLGATPAPVSSPDEARDRVARWASRTRDGLGIWAMVARDGGDPGTPVGTVLLVPLPRSDGTAGDDLEIGWHLHPDHWGRGLASEAGSAMIEQARAVGAPRVRAVLHEANTRSAAVCERLGMTRVGRTDRWYGVELVEYLLELDRAAAR